MSAAHVPSRSKLARLAALACAVVLSSFLAATANPAVAGDQGQPAGPPRLDSHLARIVDAFRQAGIEGASATAAQLDIDLQGNAVRVIIKARPGPTATTIAVARSHGARVAQSNSCDGFASARNASPALATGEWILWMDAGDILLPADLAKVRWAEQLSPDIALSFSLVHQGGADATHMRHAQAFLDRSWKP